MRSVCYAIVLSLLTAVGSASAQTADTLDHKLGDVVVTGTRVAADQRHQPYTVSVVGREKLTEQQRLNILPTLCEEVPGLFLTSRGVMGYAVSTNAAGGLSLRGLGSSTGQMLVLIDGHPQYQGIYSHSIADASQTMLADRVEVLRGPASVLYGS
ncbi:MAG: Plug domain-containing protein, partial [Bacteroidaceae bacterium]|nr:Plug domain-containing protein [Bacteroidaceae bacterium]